MKNTILFALIMSTSSSAFAQSGSLSDAGDNATTKYNEKSISATASNGDVFYKSQRDLDDDLKKALALYKEEKYAEAQPLLTELSQWGVKKAQMLLGGMYMHGFHLEQSTELALAWLGVAKEAKTERQAEKMFKHVYTQLNKEQKSHIDNLVGTYIAKFGVKAQNLKCKKHVPAGSNIPVRHCEKKAHSNSVFHPVS